MKDSSSFRSAHKKGMFLKPGSTACGTNIEQDILNTGDDGQS